MHLSLIVPLFKNRFVPFAATAGQDFKHYAWFACGLPRSHPRKANASQANAGI
jgi:hypothetical protein